MSTFQPTMGRGIAFGLLGTGNLAQSISRNRLGDDPNFLTDILARLPDTLRDTVREPYTYAPYRDSLNHLMEVVQHVSNGECELDALAYPRFVAAAATAIEILIYRPMSVPLPEIDVRQSGKIEFEWYQGPRKLVSFTIDNNRKLVCSALIGTEKIPITSYLQSQWPPAIVALIKRVMA